MNDAIKMNDPKEAYARGERDFRDLPLAYVDLSGAYLENTDFSGADLFCATLRSADLRGVKFCGANLFGASLKFADLRGADVSGSDIREVDFSGAFIDDVLRRRIEGGER